MEIDGEKSPQKEKVSNEEPMETDTCDEQQSSSTDDQVTKTTLLCKTVEQTSTGLCPVVRKPINANP